MSSHNLKRRDFLKTLGLTTAAITLPNIKVHGSPQAKNSLLTVDPQPKFDLSPNLYMQFMEPLSVTDSSVDAAWDFKKDRWRQDVIDITKELSPTMMRWGGCFISYYRWKEGVGPMNQRKPMLNMLWGGIYNNQVGTHEFMDFCRQVGADPLMCVNFESDGRKYWMKDPKGNVRKAGPEEAAEWVDYCNNPSNKMRISHGRKETYDLKLWQIGNETSHDPDAYSCEQAAERTITFAKAMRKSDPDIKLIGWGEHGWARKMYEIAGEHLQYIAFHNGFGPSSDESPLRGIEYRKDWDKTWEYLMTAYQAPESRINAFREEISGIDIPIGITECHFALPGRNRCEVLSTWGAGVANARLMNVHERNGDMIKIATLADFCGTRWQNNAIMIPVPWGKAFMMPVAMVMSLYRKHSGEKSCHVASTPDGLDVTASRTGNRVFLHVINTNRKNAVTTQLNINGLKIKSGHSFCIALDPEYEVFELKPEITSPKKAEIPADGKWTFPAASVSAVELDV